METEGTDDPGGQDVGTLPSPRLALKEELLQYSANDTIVENIGSILEQAQQPKHKLRSVKELLSNPVRARKRSTVFGGMSPSQRVLRANEKNTNHSHVQLAPPHLFLRQAQAELTEKRDVAALPAGLESASHAAHVKFGVEDMHAFYEKAYEVYNWKPARRSTVMRRIDAVCNDGNVWQANQVRHTKPKVKVLRGPIVWDCLNTKQSNAISTASTSSTAKLQTPKNPRTAAGAHVTALEAAEGTAAAAGAPGTSLLPSLAATTPPSRTPVAGATSTQKGRNKKTAIKAHAQSAKKAHSSTGQGADPGNGPQPGLHPPDGLQGPSPPSARVQLNLPQLSTMVVNRKSAAALGVLHQRSVHHHRDGHDGGHEHNLDHTHASGGGAADGYAVSVPSLLQGLAGAMQEAQVGTQDATSATMTSTNSATTSPYLANFLANRVSRARKSLFARKSIIAVPHHGHTEMPMMHPSGAAPRQATAGVESGSAGAAAAGTCTDARCATSAAGEAAANGGQCIAAGTDLTSDSVVSTSTQQAPAGVASRDAPSSTCSSDEASCQQPKATSDSSRSSSSSDTGDKECDTYTTASNEQLGIAMSAADTGDNPVVLSNATATLLPQLVPEAASSSCAVITLGRQQAGQLHGAGAQSQSPRTHANSHTGSKHITTRRTGGVVGRMAGPLSVSGHKPLQQTPTGYH